MGRSLRLHLTADQVSDFKGAAALLDVLSSASFMIADHTYDADWFRTALQTKGLEACISPKRNRKKTLYFNKTLYKALHNIENMFARLKDWRRIATQYD